MSDLQELIDRYGITEEELEEARTATQAKIDAYNLKEARKAANLTQVQVAQAIGVSQNRISRMENGDLGAMSVDSLRRYVSALGGTLTLIANLPSGSVQLAQ